MSPELNLWHRRAVATEEATFPVPEHVPSGGEPQLEAVGYGQPSVVAPTSEEIPSLREALAHALAMAPIAATGFGPHANLQTYRGVLVSGLDVAGEQLVHVHLGVINVRDAVTGTVATYPDVDQRLERACWRALDARHPGLTARVFVRAFATMVRTPTGSLSALTSDIWLEQRRAVFACSHGHRGPILPTPRADAPRFCYTCARPVADTVTDDATPTVTDDAAPTVTT